MKSSQKIFIIGIGDDGLDGVPAATRKVIEEADLLIGAERTLESITASNAERLAVGANLDEAVDRIAAAEGKKIAVLASGDPLFYGLARYLGDKLGKDHFQVMPHVSSMQLAFARVMESWEDAYLTDVTNHRLENIVERIRTATKVGLFTSEASGPNHVAQALLDREIDYFSAYVCENLGSPDERVTQGELPEIASLAFAPLNVMILVRKPDVPDRPADKIGHRRFGNPDEAFLQSKPKEGLLTPAEVRSLALAELDLGPRSIIWDVGAGSGSVSIEAAQLASDGMAYAIEMDAEDHELIEENAQRFGVSNLVAVLGSAPEVFAELPDPDAVFAQGSGREISRLVEASFSRLRPGGRLVASCRSVENLAELQRTLLQMTPEVKVLMLNISRGTPQFERMRFEALNPSFLLSAVKGV